MQETERDSKQDFLDILYRHNIMETLISYIKTFHSTLNFLRAIDGQDVLHKTKYKSLVYESNLYSNPFESKDIDYFISFKNRPSYVDLYIHQELSYNNICKLSLICDNIREMVIDANEFIRFFQVNEKYKQDFEIIKRVQFLTLCVYEYNFLKQFMLDKCEDLVNLMINCTQYQFVDLYQFKNVKNLWLINCEIEFYPSLNLEKLYLKYNGCKDVNLFFATNLKHLTIEHNPLQSVFIGLSNINLQSLVITHTPCNMFSYFDILNLTHLDLSYNNITLFSYNYLPNLKYLNLQNNKITDISSLKINNLEKLETLNLSNNLIEKKIKFDDQYSFNKSLETLIIRNNSISSVKFTDYNNLTFLDISYNRLRSIIGIVSLQKLKVFHIHHNEMRDLSQILNFTNLEDLYIFENDENDENKKTYFDVSELLNLKKINIK